MTWITGGNGYSGDGGQGFDPTWVDAGGHRTAYYTNVPPGRYRYRVIASNDDGVWNQAGTAVALHLRPHFYPEYAESQGGGA